MAEKKISSRDCLTNLAMEIQDARANDLEKYVGKLKEDTYTLDKTTHYWPAGESGSPYDLVYFMNLSPSEKDIIEEFESKHPYTYLDHGNGRIVFTSDTDSEIVVKIGRWGTSPEMGNGVNMNYREYKLYTKLKDTEINGLLPILDIEENSNWTVQPKVKPYSSIKKKNKPCWSEVKKVIHNRLGILKYIITDRSKDNIGLWKDNWYYIDYAMID